MEITQDLSCSEDQWHVFSHGAKKCLDFRASSDPYIFKYQSPNQDMFSFDFEALTLELRLSFILTRCSLKSSVIYFILTQLLLSIQLQNFTFILVHVQLSSPPCEQRHNGGLTQWMSVCFCL